jgi:hypothetical protein
MAKAFKEKRECSSCHLPSKDLEMFGVVQFGSGKYSSVVSLSSSQKYRIEYISQTFGLYISKRFAPPSGLARAMAKSDAKEKESNFQRLLRERMKLHRIGDEDLYQDLRSCLYDCVQGEYEFALFSIFFECISHQPDLFALPLLDLALKWSVGSKDKRVFTFLINNCLKFSSSGLCDALRAAGALQEESEFQERAKAICSIDIKLQFQDLEPFLNELIASSGYSGLMKFPIQMLEIFLQAGKISEEMKIKQIHLCVSTTKNPNALMALSQPPISQREREEALLAAMQLRDVWGSDWKIVKFLLSEDEATISPDCRGKAVLLSLEGVSQKSKDYNLEMTIFIASGGPLSAHSMQRAVERASSLSDLRLLSSLIDPSVLNNVQSGQSPEFYWAYALEKAANFGNQKIIELLLNEKKFRFEAIEAALMQVCSKRCHGSLADDLVLLALFLKNLPPSCSLSGTLLCTGLKRQEFEILRALLAHRESHPHQWLPISEKEWTEALQSVFFFRHTDSLELRDSDAAFQFLLEKEGDKIPLHLAIDLAIAAWTKFKPLTKGVLRSSTPETIHTKLKSLLAEARRRNISLSNETKQQLICIAASGSGYEDFVKALLRPSLDKNRPHSVGYWEEMVQPGLELAIAKGNLEMVKILLECGEISSKMKLKAIAQIDGRHPEILSLLKSKAPIYQGRWDRIKPFFIDLWMRLASFLASLCSWRS